MLIPLQDIITVSKQRAFRFGLAALVVVLKGHEELFLEMSQVARNACHDVLQRSVPARNDSDLRDIAHPPRTHIFTSEQSDHESDLGQSVKSSPSSRNLSPSRTQGPLRFTCLTIGSRGDVQPYIVCFLLPSNLEFTVNRRWANRS